MLRRDAEAIARQITKTLIALEGHPAQQSGARAVALMIAGLVEVDGRMTATTFVKLCGLRDPHRRFSEMVEEDEGLLGGVTAVTSHPQDHLVEQSEARA